MPKGNRLPKHDPEELERFIKYLQQGPRRIDEITKDLGLKRRRAYLFLDTYIPREIYKRGLRVQVTTSSLDRRLRWYQIV